MSLKNRLIHSPTDETVIWKYLDLWKFLDLLDKKQLYLRRGDLLDDDNEGFFPSNHQISNIINQRLEPYQKHAYLTCFTKNEKETFPLWRIYTDYILGISFKTTVGKLKQSLSSSKEITPFYIGDIEYLQSSDKINFYKHATKPHFQKREFFSFEEEIRILVLTQDNDYPEGIHLDLNIDDLIDEVKVSPRATEGFKNIVEEKLCSLNLNTKVSHSLMRRNIN